MIPQRTPLGKVLPLSTPFSLHIFPTYFCNFHCNYCLHSCPDQYCADKQYYRQVMELDLFKKVIDDSKQFKEKLKSIFFSGYGEPLMNPYIAEMVQYAVQRDASERIEIVTNGSLLTPQLSDALIDAGLTTLRVSIQGISAERYKEVCGTNIDFDQFISNLHYFYTQKKETNVYIKIIDSALRDTAEKEKFYEIFSPVADDVNIEHLVPAINSIDYSKVGTISGLTQTGSAAGTKFCSSIFYSLEIWPEGTIIPCCNIESPPIILGNIKDMSLKDIWESDARKNFLLQHLDGYKSIPSCSFCTYPIYSLKPEDRLDEYIDVIKRNFRSERS